MNHLSYFWQRIGVSLQAKETIVVWLLELDSLIKYFVSLILHLIALRHKGAHFNLSLKIEHILIYLRLFWNLKAHEWLWLVRWIDWLRSLREHLLIFFFRPLGFRTKPSALLLVSGFLLVGDQIVIVVGSKLKVLEFSGFTCEFWLFDNLRNSLSCEIFARLVFDDLVLRFIVNAKVNV